MKTSMSVSETVSEAITEAFTDIFESFKSTLTLSETSTFDWSELDTETKSEATSYTVEVTLPAGLKVHIMEAVGACGGSKVQTQMFK